MSLAPADPWNNGEGSDNDSEDDHRILSRNGETKMKTNLSKYTKNVVKEGQKLKLVALGYYQYNDSSADSCWSKLSACKDVNVLTSTTKSSAADKKYI
jgi:hypothetical protein